MSYVQRVLQPSETLICATRLHWLIYGRAVVFLGLALLAAGFASESETDLRFALWLLAAGLLAVAVIDFFAATLRRHSTELAVTDLRLIYKRGIVSRARRWKRA